MTQTERVGPFLDGSVMVVEGKAFDAEGRPNGFNALAVISYDPDAKTYTFTSYAQGYAQAVPFTVRPRRRLVVGAGRRARPNPALLRQQRRRPLGRSGDHDRSADARPGGDLPLRAGSRERRRHLARSGRPDTALTSSRGLIRRSARKIASSDDRLDAHTISASNSSSSTQQKVIELSATA